MTIELLAGCGGGSGGEFLGLLIVVIIVLVGILSLAGSLAVTGGIMMRCSRNPGPGGKRSATYHVGRCLLFLGVLLMAIMVGLPTLAIVAIAAA